MRRLKHKHTRRAIRFFRIRHGFREPFKVIFDGNFVAAVRDLKMGEPAEVAQKLLGAPVKAYVTRCVLLELKAKGKEYAEVWRAAKKAGLHLNCQHDAQPLPGWECLKSCVGARNEEHYFVATQERLLRAQLGRIPGGAALFVSPNGAHLEAPSGLQKATAQQEDVAEQVVQQEELSAPALEALPELQAAARRAAGGRSIFRRKGAKGPNPLSVRKKKPKERGAGRPGAAGAGAGAAAVGPGAGAAAVEPGAGAAEGTRPQAAEGAGPGAAKGLGERQKGGAGVGQEAGEAKRKRPRVRARRRQGAEAAGSEAAQGA